MNFPYFLRVLCAVSGVLIIVGIHRVESIKCWECRSDADNRCSDPFDNSTFHYTDCDQISLPHISGIPTMCRKIRQKVEGEWRYIRGCAWLSDPEKMRRRGDERYCLIRSGTWDIHIEYCECWSKDGCNSAPYLTKSSQILLFLIAALTVYVQRPPF